MEIKLNQKLLFIGDSITDCDRVMPHGEGGFGALGKGYVSFVDALLQAVYPELGIRVVNKGISGHTVRDLKNRWHEDVMAQKPDWLSIMIGINDVWRQYDTPFIKENHVYAEEYEETLRKLVTDTQPLVEQIVLMSPFYLESNEQDKMRQTMNQYGHIVKKIAEDTNCLFVDTQAAFNVVLKELYSAALAWDRVHPSAAGHMVLARAFLNRVGFEWARSSLASAQTIIG
ncbi:SGNH/GDSL hydrolase family protein [Heyndrickxia acidicola]|uniref:SGNH/GDSL hydrolase family protein n=1 Tax=Heyndrickxia acidicola TaxID=209389 RepID=A0ABU6MG21_9BACI|nr:SGNH/GDSL hydrolase family protein [Heyndrickxia acidicola]MED1202217.1 SGNH/GDSL hydrolase family protein [Heyndrickxia acidicola]